MASDVVRVFCLDVGQGDATVVVGPAPGTAIIVDAFRADPVLDVLRQHNVTHLPLALLTHDDHDHVAGFAAVLEEFLDHMGGRVKLVACDQDRLHASGVWKRLLARLNLLAFPNGPLGHRRFSLCSPTTDSRCLQGILHGARIARLVYPSFAELSLIARLKGKPNEASAILLLEWRGQRMLLGADLGSLGWTILTRKMKMDIRADIFRFPHHGGRWRQAEVNGETISLSELLDRVQPSAVVISVGTGNGLGHPAPETVSAICSRPGIRLLCTEATTHCLGDPPHGATHHRVEPAPCAGTVVVTLGASAKPTVAPSKAKHGRVISDLPTPLCRRPADQGLV